MIWIKHLFGLCEQPKTWYETVMKWEQALPNSIIYFTAEEHHYWVHHYLDQKLGRGTFEEAKPKGGEGQ